MITNFLKKFFSTKLNVINFVKSRHEKILSMKNEKYKDEVYYNLKNDNYNIDEDSFYLVFAYSLV